MFGKEIGSLGENLVLNTAGKVKIRLGQKYIDLLNEKGESWEGIKKNIA